MLDDETMAQVQERLNDLVRTILDTVSVEMDIHDADGHALESEDDFNITVITAGEGDNFVSRVISLRGMLETFAREYDHELQLVSNIRRLKAIGKLATSLAAELEADWGEKVD